MGLPAGSTGVGIVDGGAVDPSKVAAVANVHSQDANAPAAGWFKLLVGSFSQLWNGATFDRQAGGGDNADGIAVGAVGRLFASARAFIYNGVTWDRQAGGTDNADGVAVATLGRLFACARGFLFNGVTWDRARGNMDNISLAVLANPAVGTVNSADQVNYNARGIKLVIDITAVGGGTTLVVNLQVKDPVSGKYITVLASAVLAGVATTVLTLYPGATAAANVTVNDVLTRSWRIQTVTAVSNSISATVAASLIV